MSHQLTIDSLVNDLTPVKRVSLLQVMLLWLVVSVGFGAFYLWQVGIRPDLAYQLQQPMFLLALLSYLLSFFMASYYAIAIALPSKNILSFRNVLIVTGIKACFSLVFYSNALSPAAWSAQEFSSVAALGCCLRISFGALFPTLVLTYILSRLAPFQLKQSIGFGWFSAAVMVSIVSQLNCPIDDLFHIWVGHGLLLFIVGFGAYFFMVPLARYFCRKATAKRLPEDARAAVKNWFHS